MIKKEVNFIFSILCLIASIALGVTVTLHSKDGKLAANEGKISSTVVTTTTTSTTSTTIPGNLIQNDSFEIGTGTVCAAWTYDIGYLYTGPGSEAKMKFRAGVSPNPYGLLDQIIPSATKTGEAYRIIFDILDNDKQAGAYISPYFENENGTGYQIKTIGTHTQTVFLGTSNNLRILGWDGNYETNKFISIDNVFLFDLGVANATISGFVAFAAYNGTWHYAGVYSGYPYYTNNVSSTLTYLYKYPENAWMIHSSLGTFTSERNCSPVGGLLPIGTWVFDVYPDYEEGSGSLSAP